MQELVSKKAVLESRISALCQKLGLDHVPSPEELDGMLREHESRVSEMSARCAELESAVSAWESRYSELNGGGLVSQ